MQQLLLLSVATFSAAFVASLPPGLLNMNAAKTSVEKGKKNGITFGLGVGFTVMIQAYLAVRIAKLLSQNPEIIEILMQLALVIFGVLAIFFFVKGKKQTTDTVEFVEGKKRGSFSKGAFLAALNLLTIPYYAGINTFFNGQGFMNYTLMDEIIFIISAGCGTFLAMYVYVFYFDKMEQRTNRFSKNANYILSGLMILLFAITLLRLYF
ncbi:lysine transporter LysE [Maribacter algarum]|uniref:Lysine transporter LysE n=1 Tax=Maribacter algarum (ex Zhang et al. 2020) TaxID=2578118 RepID=A0A5S3QNC3_9FLAO|nr:LysE family transporter [Maribacter algarum]TMM59394.1 lysine transporter LysE [Maribacter algarum]